MPAALPRSGGTRNGSAARARTSGENLFVVLLVMALPSQELEPPAIPGRFKVTFIPGLLWAKANFKNRSNPAKDASPEQLHHRHEGDFKRGQSAY